MGQTSTKPASASPHRDKTCTQFGLHNSKHHLVIGKGGVTVKTLQKEHEVNISVNDDDTLVIEGNGKGIEATRKALVQITGVEIDSSPVCRYELGVPGHKYGAVIGAKGCNIREIESKAKVIVEVPQKHLHDLPVVLIGTEKSCETGKKLVEDLIGQTVGVTKKTKDGFEKVAVETVDLRQVKPRVLFFPERTEPEGCRTMQIVLRYLNSCKKSLDICVFTLTNDDLASVIIAAHRRNVAVRIITDNTQAVIQGCDVPKFLRAGIPVRVDSKPEHMHHKFAILDNQIVLNGSFNWTVQAQTSNNENITVLSDPTIIKSFHSEFETLWSSFKGNHVPH